MQKNEIQDIIEWIGREKKKTELRLQQACDRGDALAVERLEEKIKNYDIAVSVIRAAQKISEGKEMLSEKGINNQCDRCSEEYRKREGCPKERGCGSIMLLACRIQSMEHDNRKQEGK